MPFRRAMLGLACTLAALGCSTPQSDPSPAGEARSPDAGPASPVSDSALCCRDADRVVLRFDGAPGDAFKGPGWYRNERSDDPTWGTFAWAKRNAVAYFATPRTDEPDLVAVCAPFESASSPPQSVSLVLNGHPVATRRMHRGWHELRVPLPKEALDDSVNTLALKFAHTGRPTAGTDRPLSAACREIGVVPRGSSDLEPRVRWNDRTRILQMRPDARTAIPLPAAQRLDITLGEVTADAAARLSLSVLDTSGRTTELWRGPAVRAAHLGLPVRLEGGTATELVVEVTAPGTEPSGEAVALELPRAVFSTPAEDAGPAPGPPSVFVYLIDTLRADALGAYGGPPSNSPRIDRFASDAVVYERAWSTSAWTLPATASVLTGLYPPNHGARTGEVKRKDPPTTLGGLLATRGFETLFVSQSYIASAVYGLDAGFTASYVNDVLGSEMQASDRVRWFLWRYLRRRPDDHRPLFAYLHTVDPHHPYMGSAAPRGGRHPEKPMTLEDGPGAVLGRGLPNQSETWPTGGAGFRTSGRSGSCRMMASLLRALGIRTDAPPTRKGEVHDRIHAELPRLGEERLEYLAAFAGLLARAAFGDAEISSREEEAMQACLRDEAGLEAGDAELVAHIARNATEALGDVENYLLTRAFNERATPAEKEMLLDCLYLVAEADGTVAIAEDDEIKQIGSALMVPHSRVMDIRAKHRDALEVLRNLPT